MAGRVFGTRAAREQVAISDEPETPAYPDLPRPLLKIIFEGHQISISRRALAYVVILGNHAIHADDVNVSKWVLHNYGNQLDSEKFQLACDLLCERVRQQIKHYDRMTRQAERDEAKALTTTWGAGNDLSNFFGR